MIDLLFFTTRGLVSLLIVVMAMMLLFSLFTGASILPFVAATLGGLFSAVLVIALNGRQP